MKKLFFAFIALWTISVYAQKDYSVQYADLITPAELKAKLSVIASAEMEGRETATPGQKRAATFIETNFKRFGLLPATTAGYQMHYAVYQDTLINVSLKVGGKDFAFAKTFSLTRGSAINGNYNIREVEFIGKGDSASLAGKDLKNKWVVLELGSPNRTALAAKLLALRAKGIKGYLNISASFPSTTATLKGSMYIKPAATNNSIPSINISYEVASAIFNETITSSAGLLNVSKKTYTTGINLNVYKRSLLYESSNVIGLLPGTDKKDEYVFLTAHYDHLGKRGDVIYYGADDDGSGTASVLQMAEAFGRAKAEGHGPRRTIVFMTVSGEEKGLLGSEFYSEHPLFPHDKTSVDLNTDMVGRIDSSRREADTTNYVFTIGENKLSSDLIHITDSVKNKYSALVIDRRFNKNDPQSFYTRSDHYNFARKGVPIIFYFDGLHADYHKPTDTVDKINFDLMAKRVQFIFHTAWIMANRDAMLTRDLPL